MPNRGASKYHKVRSIPTRPNPSYCITLSKRVAIRFKECPMEEILFDKGILLLKSGCNINNERIYLKIGVKK